MTKLFGAGKLSTGVWEACLQVVRALDGEEWDGFPVSCAPSEPGDRPEIPEGGDASSSDDDEVVTEGSEEDDKVAVSDGSSVDSKATKKRRLEEQKEEKEQEHEEDDSGPDLFGFGAVSSAPAFVDPLAEEDD